MQKEKWNAQAYAKHSKGQEIWARELIGKLADTYFVVVHRR